jgi:transcriptional regulator CtsR
MPYNVDVWIDDGHDCLNIYIDDELITERGARALEAVFRRTVVGWQRVDRDVVLRTLRAVTG